MKHILMILALVFVASAAQAHFIIGTENREIHVMESEDGDTRVIMRFPLTLAYATELAQRAPGAAFTGPFMKTEMVGGATYYQLDRDAVYSDYEGFARFLLRDFRFSVNGAVVTPEYLSFAIVDTHAQRGSENAPPIEPGVVPSETLLSICVTSFPEQAYISDALVVVSFYLSEIWPTDSLKIELLSSPFPVPEGMYFETRITDHRDGSANLLAFQGTGFEPVVLAGSWLSSFWHFLKQGAYHILIGFDHVLYVLLLVIAAANLQLLVLAVTGFTVGHSVTLGAGALGFVPQGAWFIPFVELLVAASILLMGALILLRRSRRQGFWLAGGIGLLHGFGFSFMLGNMLGGTRDGLVTALAGFNVGVEVGQLAIVLPAFAILTFTAHKYHVLDKLLRYGIAGFASIMAIMMILERTALLQESLTNEPTELSTLYSNPNVANITQTTATGA